MKAKNISWGLYIRNGFARRLAQMGGVIGSERLIYNGLVMGQFHDEAVANAAKVIPAFLTYFPASQRYLDVGSGSGAFSAELMRRSKTVVALERSPHGRALATKQGVDCRPFDLTKNPAAEVSEGFDVLFCFEVAEHMPVALGDRLVEFLAGFNSTVVFSAAQPGQGGTGHINEQPCDYWIARFEKFGFRFDSEATKQLRDAFTRNGAAQWFRNNPLVLHPGV